MKPVLLIVAKEGYQDQEEAGTHDALEKAGHAVILASTEADTCTGKFGGTLKADVSLKDVQVDDYQAIVFIGGPGAAALADHPEALRIARDAALSNMLLGAICIAPTILAKAGVLNGKRVTVWNDAQQTQAQVLIASGAQFVDQAVVVDGDLITGNGPQAAAEFGQALVTALT